MKCSAHRDDREKSVAGLNAVSVPNPTGTGISTSGMNYDSSGRVSSVVDANGNQRVYTIGSGSTTVQVKDRAGTVAAAWTQNFNGDRRNTGVTDAAGRSSQIVYGDGVNPSKPTQVTDKSGRPTAFAYDNFGNVTSTTDARGVVTAYTYDYAAFPMGRLRRVQVGANQPTPRTPTTYTYYEPSGLVKTITGAAPGTIGSGPPVTTTYTYDSLGNVLTVTTPGNNAAGSLTTTYNYTQDGAYSQPAALGRPLTITDPQGLVTHLRYDSEGRVTSSVDALGSETDTSYNVAGQPIQVTSPATGQTGTGRAYSLTAYLYPGGPPTSTTWHDESGAQVRQVSTGYGLEGETLSVTGSTEPVAYAYDALYRMVALSDGNGHATRYAYNPAGQVASVTYPGGDTVQYPSYDPDGNPLQRIDGRGIVTNYLYNDPEGQLTDIQYPASPGLNVHLTFDEYGRRSGMTDGTGSQSYAYDDRDALLSETVNPLGLPAQTLSYSYYPDGSRQSLGTPAGTFSYAYNANGRLTALTNPRGETSSWQYLNNGWLWRQTLGNGAVTAYTYNALGQTTDLQTRTAGGAPLSDFGGMIYDGVGNRTALTASLPGAPAGYSGTTGYGYDGKDQLTQEQSQRAGGYSSGFAYDAAGNPTTSRGAAGNAFNANNQVVGAGFGYDAAGNPTTYRGAGLFFDPENRLTQYGGALTAGYTGDGLRAWKQGASGRTYFLYDGDTPVVELDGSGSVTAVNTFGAAGLLSRHTGTGSAFYTFDPQGSVAQRLDAAGNVTSSDLYDAFGSRQSTGRQSTGGADVFGYGAQHGYYTDAETGLILCTHRYYDPSTGRFVTRDPSGYGGGINLYGYVGNNPVNGVDPSGLHVYHPGPWEPSPVDKIRYGITDIGIGIGNWWNNLWPHSNAPVPTHHMLPRCGNEYGAPPCFNALPSNGSYSPPYGSSYGTLNPSPWRGDEGSPINMRQ